MHGANRVDGRRTGESLGSTRTPGPPGNHRGNSRRAAVSIVILVSAPTLVYVVVRVGVVAFTAWANKALSGPALGVKTAASVKPHTALVSAKFANDLALWFAFVAFVWAARTLWQHRR